MEGQKHRPNYGYCVFPKLRAALRETGMDRHAVAGYLEISDSNAYHWLTGGNARVLLVITKLLDLTGLTFEEAFGEIDEGDKGE